MNVLVATQENDAGHVTGLSVVLISKRRKHRSAYSDRFYLPIIPSIQPHVEIDAILLSCRSSSTLLVAWHLVVGPTTALALVQDPVKTVDVGIEIRAAVGRDSKKILITTSTEAEGDLKPLSRAQKPY